MRTLPRWVGCLPAVVTGFGDLEAPVEEVADIGLHELFTHPTGLTSMRTRGQVMISWR